MFIIVTCHGIFKACFGNFNVALHYKEIIAPSAWIKKGDLGIITDSTKVNEIFAVLYQ